MAALAPEPGPVVVVGSVNMDLVFTGLSALPAPGQTVGASDYQALPGGKGANQASAASAAGARVELVARVGDDELGAAALRDLSERGVGLHSTEVVPGATGVAGVLIDQHGENVVIVAPGANATLGPDSAQHPDLEHAVVLACLEIPLPTVLAWARLCRERGGTFVLNPAPARPLPPELLGLVDVLTPNETELAALGDAGQLLELGVGAVVVTLGAAGVRLHTAAGTIERPAYPVEVVDTTGAGDAFNGVLAAALAEGRALPDAVDLAAAAGALATRRVGARAALAGRDELLDLVSRSAAASA